MTHETAMRAAIAEAELARGKTGDNPWVGSVLVVDDAVVAWGRTQGPGEDHAEIGSFRAAREQGIDLRRATLYSTLEPCAFHGRTPACAEVIAKSGVLRLVTGIRDPNPRVDGAGVAIVRAAGIEVIEDVCEQEIRRQLGAWILKYHPHEITRRAATVRELRDLDEESLRTRLAELYAVDRTALDDVVRPR